LGRRQSRTHAVGVLPQDDRVRRVDAATEGAGGSMYGRVASYGPGREAPCFVCSYDRAQFGRAVSFPREACPSWWNAAAPESLPTLSASPECGVLAGIQCTEGIRRLLGDVPDDDSYEVLVHLDRFAMQRVQLQRNDACLMPHEAFEPLEEVGAPCDITLKEVFETGRDMLGGAVTLQFHRRALVHAFRCGRCGAEMPVGRLDTALDDAAPACDCGGRFAPAPWDLLHEVDEAAALPFLERTMAELGLPEADIVSACTRDEDEPGSSGFVAVHLLFERSM